MQAPAALKRIVYPSGGGLHELLFRERRRWLIADVPDDERFGLARELILQRIYDAVGPIDGGLVVDAGANTGLFSLIASRSADRVVALEPGEEQAAVATANLARNRADNVTLINAALWTDDGQVCFKTGSERMTDGSVSRDGDVIVDAVSLDTIVDRYGPIDLLKLDIEGAEEQVIPATRALENVRRIVAELHLHRPGDEAPMIAALERQGFAVKLVPAAELYAPRWVQRVFRNWRRLRGELLIKVGVIAYLLAPLTKPRRPGRDMPLLVATRRQRPGWSLDRPR